LSTLHAPGREVPDAPPRSERLPKARRDKNPALRRNNRIGYLFIAPSIVGFFLYVAYPLVMGAYYALTKWNGVTTPQFIGFDNFVYMFTQDPLFWNTVLNTLVFAVVSVPLNLIFGLGLAVLLNRKLKGVKIFRTIFFLPVVLPSVAVLTMWKYLFDPQFGFANQVLAWFHLPASGWLTDPHTSLATIILIGIWGVGSTMIIFLAGLQNVPDELSEAGRLDGAGPIRLFFSVTLPMITPILLLQLILQINAAFQAFNQVALTTQGGPNNSTNLLMYKIYNDGFGATANVGTPLMGYATAEVWVLFALVMIVTAFTFRTSSSWVYNAGDRR
jgi:ABC-type sugar transport system permease subunit